MNRRKPALLIRLCALVCAALCGGPAAAADSGDGLPLVPQRRIAFETDQGTWMSAGLAPDGRTIAFDLLGDLYRIDATGGAATRLTQGMAFDSQPVFSPDGAQIAFLSDRSGAENLWVAHADGTGARRVTDNEGPNEFISPAWSPGGQDIFVSLYRADRNAIELWRYDLANGAGEEITTRGVNALGAAPSPDGRSLYYSRRDGPVFQDDVRLPLWSIERRDLASGRTETIITNQGSAMRPALSPDGSLLAYAVRKEGQTGLRLRNLRTGDDRMLVFPIQHDAQESLPTRDLVPGYSFTPDGAAIVLTRAGGFQRIEVASGAAQEIRFKAQVDLELGPLLRQTLVEETGPVRARLIQDPRQSPDGAWLAFSALGRIHVMELRAGSKPRRLTRDGPAEYQPAWSANGRQLAYVTWTGAEGGAIWIADRKSGRTRRLTTDEAFYTDVAFTPDSASVVALRSSAEDRRQTIQEPLWTGRSGGFLRQAELLEISLRDGSSRGIASGPMGGAPQSTQAAGVLYLNTEAGLEVIRRDGSGRALAVQVTGPAYYFLDVQAPAADIKLSPDRRHALVVMAQQLYLVTLHEPGAAVEAIDIETPGAPVRRLTRTGADFTAWANDGRTITWALGSTYFRLPLVDANAGEDGAESFAVNVEAARDAPTASCLLRGATVISMRGDEVLANADLLVAGNRIAAIGPRGSVAVPSGTAVRDVAGKFIVPGLIDAHMHFGGIRRNLLQFDDWGLSASLAWGITSALDPSSLSIDMFAYADLIDAGQVLGPRLYTTGTALFSFNRLASLPQARDLLRRYRDFYRTRNIKQYRVGSRRVRQWVAMASQELGMMPTTEGALDMKMDLTQVLDGFSGNEHSFGVFPLYRDVVELMAEARTSYVLTLQISHGGPPAGADFIARNAPLSDPRIAKWYPPNVRERAFARVPWVTPRDYVYGYMAADAAAIARAGGVVGMGSHGNNPGIGMHWEMQAHAAGGMSPLEVLRAATLGSATTIGRAAEIGSIEPGKFADFLILSADPLADIRNTQSIVQVVKNGRVYDAGSLEYQ